MLPNHGWSTANSQGAPQWCQILGSQWPPGPAVMALLHHPQMVVVYGTGLTTILQEWFILGLTKILQETCGDWLLSGLLLGYFSSTGAKPGNAQDDRLLSCKLSQHRSCQVWIAQVCPFLRVKRNVVQKGLNTENGWNLKCHFPKNDLYCLVFCPASTESVRGWPCFQPRSVISDTWADPRMKPVQVVWKERQSSFWGSKKRGRMK